MSSFFHPDTPFSPGIMWLDLDKIATKGFSSELSHKPQKKSTQMYLAEHTSTTITVLDNLTVLKLP